MRPSRGMVMMKEKARALATEHYKAHAPGTRSYFRLASEGNDAAGSVDRPAAESDYAAVILSLTTVWRVKSCVAILGHRRHESRHFALVESL